MREGKDGFPEENWGKSSNSSYINYVPRSVQNTLYPLAQFSQQLWPGSTMILYIYIYKYISPCLQPVSGGAKHEPRQSVSIERGYGLCMGETTKVLSSGEP